MLAVSVTLSSGSASVTIKKGSEIYIFDVQISRVALVCDT